MFGKITKNLLRTISFSIKNWKFFTDWTKIRNAIHILSRIQDLH